MLNNRRVWSILRLGLRQCADSSSRLEPIPVPRMEGLEEEEMAVVMVVMAAESEAWKKAM
jgi:hypothetical protein